MRGGTDLGFLVKIKDGRVKSGVRVFKIKVDGAEKKAELAGFGQVDMQGTGAAKAAKFSLWKSDGLGCAMLLSLTVCLTMLTSFVLPFASLINMIVH